MKAAFAALGVGMLFLGLMVAMAIALRPAG
jgi:hypothetical protein